jgi:hypothetical protein
MPTTLWDCAASKNHDTGGNKNGGKTVMAGIGLQVKHLRNFPAFQKHLTSILDVYNQALFHATVEV